MILKYDIYIQVEEKIIITRLIPFRQRWAINYPNQLKNQISEYLDALQKGMSNAEYFAWVNRQPEFVKKLNEFLIENLMVSEYDGGECADYYAYRQVEVFDAWSLERCHPQKYQDNLENAVVVVVGVGGVGTSITNILSSCGVGKIYIIDGDVVEEGNLARQFLYCKKDIGRKKVDVLAERINQRGLGKIIPIDEFIVPQNVKQILKKIPEKIGLVTGMPSPSTDFTVKLYKSILTNNIPVFSLGEHDLGPVYKCPEDVDLYIKKTSAIFELQTLHNTKRNRRFIVDRHPSYLPEIEMVSGMCADEIIRYLSGYAPTNLLDGCYGLDPVDRTFKYYKLW